MQPRQRQRAGLVAELVDPFHHGEVLQAHYPPLWLVRSRERQERGLLRADVDPGHLLLAMVALTTFPAAFPQFTRLLTGLRPTDRAFATRHTAFLRRLADGLRPVRQRHAAEARR